MLSIGLLLSTMVQGVAQKMPPRVIQKYDKSFEGIGPRVYVLPKPRTKEEVLIAQYEQKKKEQTALEPILQSFDLQKQLINIDAAVLPVEIGDSSATSGLEKEEEMRRAIRYYQQQMNRAAVADWQNNLAIHCLVSGEIDSARALLLAALKTKEKVGVVSEQLPILNNLALLEIRSEDYIMALSYYDRLLNEAKAVKNINHQALAYMAIARLESKLGNFSAAHNLTVEKSFPLLRKMKNYKEVVNALLDLASFKEMADKPIEAKWIYLQAIDVATTHKDEEGLAKSLYKVAELKKSIGDSQLAIADYSQAKELAVKNNMDALLIEIIDGLGDTYMQVSDYTEALLALNEYNILRAGFLERNP